MSNPSSKVKKETKKGRILKWEGSPPLPFVPNRNFASLMLEIISEHGEKVAVIDTVSGETCTYEDLRRVILSTRKGLINAGVRTGDPVIIIPDTYVYYPAILLAVMLSGAVVFPRRSHQTKDELARAIRKSRAQWAITIEHDANNLEEAFKCAGSSTLRKMWVIGKASGTSLLFEAVADSQEKSTVRDQSFDAATQCALMLTTSGTTGLPKVIMLSHKNLLTYHCMIKYLNKIEPTPSRRFHGPVILFPSSPITIYGYSKLMEILVHGNKGVIMKTFILRDYLQNIQTYKVTNLMMVPNMTKELVHSPLTDTYDLSSVRNCTTGSAPSDWAELELLQKKLNVHITEGYGLSETCAIITFNGTQMGFKPGSVGTTAPFYEAKVVDPVTGCILSEGQYGEVCARGPCIMMGYANDSEATARIIDAEGWLHTGDLGYYDEDNFIYLTNRIADVIKFQEDMVYPSSIEAVIRSMEQVIDVVVAGVPDEKFGEIPRAWVVPKPGAKIDKETIMKLVAENSADSNRLRGGVEIVKSIPRSNRGKVLRRKLRESYLASLPAV